MTRKNVDFEVTASEKIVGYSLSVNDEPVYLENGKGSMELETGELHPLNWFMTGEPGGKIGIVGKIRQEEVVNVKGSLIPPERNRGIGHRWFSFE